MQKRVHYFKMHFYIVIENVLCVNTQMDHPFLMVAKTERDALEQFGCYQSTQMWLESYVVL